MRPDFRALPKALLHDHLDGGVRVQTIIELADQIGYSALPASDPDRLSAWFHQGEAGGLVDYLSAFDHTLAVLQRPEALERVAYESALDLAADGVVYAEVRFGPSLHLAGGLRREDAIEAVVSGMKRGADESGLEYGIIAAAMRQADDSLMVAKAAARFVGSGVVGFDIAGPESGFPPEGHLAACRFATESGLSLTIHAGEHGGPDSVWQAVGRCGAARVGHGARVIEDCVVSSGEIEKVGRLARRIRDHRVPLEICITSNLHTAIAESAGDHPVGPLVRGGFNVSLNTDNRLMSGTTLSREFALAHGEAGISIETLGQITQATIEAGFGDWEARSRLIREVVGPAYDDAAAT